MTSVRLLLIRGSIFLNALLVLYLCATWLSYSPISKTPHSASSLDNHFENTMQHHLQQESSLGLRRNILGNANEIPIDTKLSSLSKSSSTSESTLNEMSAIEGMAPPPLLDPSNLREVPISGGRGLGKDDEILEPPREVQETRGIIESAPPIAPLMQDNEPPLDSQERKIYSDLRDCTTKPLKMLTTQKGNYWVLNNYVPAAMSFRCDESITYTTHSDYTFLDNLDPLTSRWQGPVSMSVYAPGDDFEASIDTILYLRSCMAEGIKKFVTFHLFFHVDHVPNVIPPSESLLNKVRPCDLPPPNWNNVTTYRNLKKLLYPVNVARNVARENSQTYFVFPSDVELYPSINFIPEFFQMLKKSDVSNTTRPRVYVFPIFEAADNQPPPETKTELQAMLKKGTAITFHKRVCARCHNQPMSKEWQKMPPSNGLSVMHVARRERPYDRWEPIFVGTWKEPIYDERLSWEGKSDKMTQMYILCVRNYEFHILDNAFLVHRPGIKVYHKNKYRDTLVAKQNKFIRAKLTPEYRKVFGKRADCRIINF